MLETAPDRERPITERPGFRERVIGFGDSGYVAVDRFAAADDVAHGLAFRHQKEAAYDTNRR